MNFTGINFVSEVAATIFALAFSFSISTKRGNNRWKTSQQRVALKFTVYPFQTCIFHWSNCKDMVIVGLYVDNILIIGNNNGKINNLKQNLFRKFEMRDLKTPRKFFSIEIIRTNDFIFINQRSFIVKILEKFNLLDCNPIRIPSITLEGEQKTEKRKTFESLQDVIEIPFRQAVDGLLYLANCTRPDITFVGNKISQKQDKYEYSDWLEIKRVFRHFRSRN